MASLVRFLRSQFLFTPPHPDTSFEGKIVPVTGANRGLGLETIRHFVRLGATKVVMAVRTISKGEDAKTDILNFCPGSQTPIEIWPLDLMSYSSVQSFAERYATLTRLDFMVCNAGILTKKLRYLHFPTLTPCVTQNEGNHAQVLYQATPDFRHVRGPPMDSNA